MDVTPDVNTGESGRESEALLVDSFHKLFETWSTSRLQDKTVDLRGTILESSPSTAAEVRISVLQNRIKRQHIYKEKLKRAAQWYKAWQTAFASLATDLEYERWLNDGDALRLAPKERAWWGSTHVTTVAQPLLRSHFAHHVGPADEKKAWLLKGDNSSRIEALYNGPRVKPWTRSGYKHDRSTHYFPESAYEIDLSSPGWATGAITLENQRLTLRWMCELGDQLQIDPLFFVEHFCRPHRLIMDRMFPLPEGYFGRWVGDMRDYCYLDGAFFAKGPWYHSVFVKPSEGFQDISVVEAEKAYVRVSCMKVDTASPLVASRSFQTSLEEKNAFCMFCDKDQLERFTDAV